MSAVHSLTLPAMSINPNPFGAPVPAAAGAEAPLNTACSGLILSPHGYISFGRPPRAAYSHSASEGNRPPPPPTQRQNACASVQETFTMGIAVFRHDSLKYGGSGRRRP